MGTFATTALLTITFAAASCPVRICATGEDFINAACVCKPDHVPDDDGKGCHRVDQPTTTLPPSGCRLPSLPECGRPEGPIGVYGCCWTGHARPLPASPFDAIVDAEQDAIDRERPGMFDRDGRVDETAYVAEMVRRLRARGLCATVGGPGDEVGLKASNTESYQYDVHLGNGRPRRSGYVTYCRPARF